jgi:WD40 repeat protein
MLLTVEVPEKITYLCLSPKGTRLAAANAVDPTTVVVVALPSGQEVARISGLHCPARMAFRSETELVLGHGPEVVLCHLARDTRQILRGEGEDEQEGEVRCVEVSPNGKTIATGIDYRGLGMLLFDATRKKKLRRVSMPLRGWVEAVRFSPDGQLLCPQVGPSDHDRWLRFLAVTDARRDKLVRLLKVPWYQGYDYPVAFRPDNRVLAVGHFSQVLLYDLYPTQSPLDPDVIFGDPDPYLDMGRSAPVACYSLGDERKVSSVRFSDEGIVVKICCTNGDALVLSADEGQVLQETRSPTEYRERLRYEVDITANGIGAGCVEGNTVLVWDVPGWGEA